MIDNERAQRVERFFERYLKHMKGTWAGQPFKLEKWQRDNIIRPLFGTVDKTGRRVFREALVGLPRKSGKSEIASGIALYGLFADGEFGAEVYSLAGSRSQARIVFKTAVDMVRSNAYLRAASRVYRDAIEVPETGSVYRVLSSDASLAHGYNPHMAVVDELHVHPNADLYEAMRTGTAARSYKGQPLILSITTAGSSKRGIAWDVYQRGLSGKDPRMMMYWQSAHDGCDLMDSKAWRQANPASWVTVQFLRDQARSLPEPTFRRLHLNQWYEAADGVGWVDMDLWDANDAAPTFNDEDPCYIGVDAAPKRDTTAVVMVQRHSDGTYSVRPWLFDADAQMGVLDYGVVEDLLRELCSSYPVERVVVDPYTMIRSMMMLASEGLPIEDFPQNDQRMVPASQSLYDLTQDKKLKHGGDPELRRHSFNAAIWETARGWRFQKRKARASMDAIVALAMACHIGEQDSQLSSAPRVLVV